LKEGEIIGEGDGQAKNVGQNQVGKQERQERKQERQARQEIGTQKGPTCQEEGDGIEGLGQGGEEQKLSIGITLQLGGIPQGLHLFLTFCHDSEVLSAGIV